MPVNSSHATTMAAPSNTTCGKLLVAVLGALTCTSPRRLPFASSVARNTSRPVQPVQLCPSSHTIAMPPRTAVMATVAAPLPTMGRSGAAVNVNVRAGPRSLSASS